MSGREQATKHTTEKEARNIAIWRGIDIQITCRAGLFSIAVRVETSLHKGYGVFTPYAGMTVGFHPIERCGSKAYFDFVPRTGWRSQ